MCSKWVCLIPLDLTEQKERADRIGGEIHWYIDLDDHHLIIIRRFDRG